MFTLSMPGWGLTQCVDSFIWSCTPCWRNISVVVVQRVILPACSCPIQTPMTWRQMKLDLLAECSLRLTLLLIFSCIVGGISLDATIQAHEDGCRRAH